MKIYYYQNEETLGGKIYGQWVGTIIFTLLLDSLKLLELSENNSLHFLSSSQNFYHHAPEPFLFVLISRADKFLHHSKDNPFIFALNLDSLTSFRILFPQLSLWEIKHTCKFFANPLIEK